jgi:hypothetical protein
MGSMLNFFFFGRLDKNTGMLSLFSFYLCRLTIYFYYNEHNRKEPESIS